MEEKTTPMAWAKRLGGPATGRAATARRGATTRVASWPSGLSVGPGQHPGPESVGEGDEQPGFAGGRWRPRSCTHHAAGHHPGRHLVHRIGEAEDGPELCVPTPDKLIGVVGFCSYRGG